MPDWLPWKEEKGEVNVDYIVLAINSDRFQSSIKEIVECVNAKMKEGYKPVGGITIVERNGLFYFAQSIIKEY